MAALTAATAVERARRNDASVRYIEKSVGTGAVVVKGGLVSINTSTGRAVASTAATGRHIAGIACATKTGNTSGTVKVRIEYNAEWKFTPKTALTKAFEGANVAVSTDNDVTTVTGAGTALVRVRVGMMTEYVSASECWVAVRNFAIADIGASA